MLSPTKKIQKFIMDTEEDHSNENDLKLLLLHQIKVSYY